jgi:putative aldouronate transport system permease protein
MVAEHQHSAIPAPAPASAPGTRATGRARRLAWGRLGPGRSRATAPRRTWRERQESALIYLGLSAFALLAVLPFLHTIARSFSAEAPIARGEVFIWPVNFTLDAYQRLIRGGAFWRGYQNSFIITTLGTAVQIAVTVLAAYPLSRPGLPGRKWLMLLLIFQMIFPPGLIPFYLTVRQVGLMNTYWAVILPYAVNTFNLVVLVNYFRALPPELEEAATIDGANDFQILWRIVLPLSMPVIMTLVLFYAVENWNMFLPAIFFINDGGKQPVQVVLRDMIWSLQLMTQTASADQLERAAGLEALKAASVFVVAIPMLIVYPFVQRFFIKGIMLGAVKQ